MDDIFLKAFGIEKGAVFITGAGGKTNLIKRLALEAKSRGMSVLITASTKMYLPDYADHVDLSGKCFEGQEISCGIYVVSEGIDHNKIFLDTPAKYNDLKERFDLMLIEADGSKKKPLKGWNHYEPVIYPCGDYTIGIINYSVLGMRLDESLVHRYSVFKVLTGLQDGDVIEKKHLYALVNHKIGLFKASSGRKILYFSHSPEDADIEKQSMMTVCGDVFAERVRVL
ncbi:MAG: selenium cofactor biosynthesis protein YqeC [Deferribacterales bacterium]